MRLVLSLTAAVALSLAFSACTQEKKSRNPGQYTKNARPIIWSAGTVPR